MQAIPFLEETTGGAGITWLVWVAIGYFVIMVGVGWLVNRKQKPREMQKKMKAVHK